MFRSPPEAKDSGYRPGNVVRWCEVQRDGRLLYHGPVWRWHRNGRQESKANYIYGAAEGDTPSWHENGRMSSHGVFKNGDKVGLWKYWDEEGRITTEVAYADSGHQRTDYYPTGKKKASGVFVSNGKIGKWTYWNADGKEKANCDFGTGVFAVTTRACQVIADELDPEGFSRPIPVGSLNADGSCSLRIADEHYVFSTPPGWVADTEAGKTEGAPLVFYPAGGTWRGDNANLYVRVLFKAGGSFETVLRQEAEGFSESVAEYSETGSSRERLNSGLSVVTRTITYKSLTKTDSPFSIVGDNKVFEALGFVDASREVVLLAVLTSPSEKDHAAATDALGALIRSLKVETKWPTSTMCSSPRKSHSARCAREDGGGPLDESSCPPCACLDQGMLASRFIWTILAFPGTNPSY